MNFCSSCYYAIKKDPLGKDLEKPKWVCGHEKAVVIDLLDGTKLPMRCNDARKSEDHCGKFGVWFEPKEEL